MLLCYPRRTTFWERWICRTGFVSGRGCLWKCVGFGGWSCKYFLGLCCVLNTQGLPWETPRRGCFTEVNPCYPSTGTDPFCWGYRASVLNTGRTTSEEGQTLLGMGGKASGVCCQSDRTLPASDEPWGGQAVPEAEELFPLSFPVALTGWTGWTSS